MEPIRLTPEGSRVTVRFDPDAIVDVNLDFARELVVSLTASETDGMFDGAMWAREEQRQAEVDAAPNN